jgi:hypothetical protein
MTSPGAAVRRVGDIAERLGRTARVAAPALSGSGGLLGPALVVAGIWRISDVAGLIAAGVIVWGLDVARGLQARGRGSDGGGK